MAEGGKKHRCCSPKPVGSTLNFSNCFCLQQEVEGKTRNTEFPWQQQLLLQNLYLRKMTITVTKNKQTVTLIRRRLSSQINKKRLYFRNLKKRKKMHACILYENMGQIFFIALMWCLLQTFFRKKLSTVILTAPKADFIYSNGVQRHMLFMILFFPVKEKIEKKKKKALSETIVRQCCMVILSMYCIIRWPSCSRSARSVQIVKQITELPNNKALSHSRNNCKHFKVHNVYSEVQLQLRAYSRLHRLLQTKPKMSLDQTILASGEHSTSASG